MEASLCVLIVDDEPAFREALALAIEDEGIAVRTAENGAKALQALEMMSPDVILLDLHMPVMNGQTFLRTYRATHPNPAPVIVCSTQRIDRVGPEFGVAAMVNKPIDIDELLVVIRRVAVDARPQLQRAHSIHESSNQNYQNA